MNTLERRIALVAGPLAVALWIVGLVVGQALPSKIPSHATDAQLLVWGRANHNTLIAGAFLFMVGCAVFLWFASVLRSRLAAAEGDHATFSTLVFGSAVAMAVLGMCTQGDAVIGIDNDSTISAATVGTLHHVGDLFFLGLEVALFPFLVGVAVVAFRTRVLPVWWASVGALVGIVALVGPIGWLAVIFGLPVWTLVTTYFLARTPRAATRRSAAVATA